MEHHPSVLTDNSATLGLGWPSARQGNLFNPAGVVEVVHYNGMAWDMFRTAIVTGSDPYTATVTGVNVFSPFIVANATALSVELLDFKATPSVLGNNLTWITANEINNKGFQVERKKEIGDSWETLGFVKGNGIASSYNFTDRTPYNVSYYRLKQMDIDGKETLSNVVSVNRDKGKETLKIYPNPVTNVLNIEIEGALNKSVQVSVKDISGRVVLQQTLSADNSTINMSSMSDGLYILEAQFADGQKQSFKLVKQ
jgi:trimeric autotransporter adhesin